jgi:hypothetical protein
MIAFLREIQNHFPADGAAGVPYTRRSADGHLCSILLLSPSPTSSDLHLLDRRLDHLWHSQQ